MPLQYVSFVCTVVEDATINCCNCEIPFVIYYSIKTSFLQGAVYKMHQKLIPSQDVVLVFHACYCTVYLFPGCLKEVL